MGFSLNGTTITQTGTDDNLGGLSSVSGVLIYSNGFQTVYDVGTRALVINGTLSHDPDTELLVSGHSASVAMSINAGAVYNYGIRTISNDNERLSGGTGLIFTGLTTSGQGQWRANSFGGLVVNGGTINFNGGVVVSSRCHGFYTVGGTLAAVNISRTRFIKRGTTARREFRFNNAEINGAINGVIIDGFQVSHTGLPDGASFNLLEGEVVQLAGGPNSTILRDFNTAANITETTDLGTDDLSSGPKFYSVINASNGSGVRTMPKSGVSNNRQRGGSIIQKEARFAVNVDGAPFGGAIVYCRDTDNGFRKNELGQNHLADKVYSVVTGADGMTPTITITTAITNIPTESNAWSFDLWDTTVNNNQYKVDRRGLDDTTADLFLVKFAAYGYLLAQAALPMRGLGVLDAERTLFVDPMVSETNRAAVDAYATIDTAAQFYDRAKSFLVVPNYYSGEVEAIVTREGDTINARGYDIDIDPNAATAFAFNGQTITIKSALFAGSIVTTGTVTTLGGASVDGLVTDRDGTVTQIRFTGLQPDSEVRIHRASDRAEIGTGIENSGTAEAIAYTYTGTDEPIIITVQAFGFQQQYIEGFTTMAAIQALNINQIIDRQFENV